MNITSLVQLIDGDLKNHPSISFVYNIQTNIAKLRDGDLFLSNDESQINQAVKAGSFGIVYENSLIKISDKEIAWIQVNKIEDAIVKLIRYFLSNIELDVFFIDEITLEILKLTSSHNYIIFDENLNENLLKAQTLQKDDIVLCCNKILLKKIYPLFKTFPIKNYELTNVTIHSIFETTFSSNGMLFPRVKVPFLYIDTFLSVIEYLDIKLPLQEIIGLKKWNLLNPIFINKAYKPIDFGKSDRFIMTTPFIKKALYQLSHIQENYTYGKIIILIDKNLSQNSKNTITYTDNEELEFFIKTLNYNLLYIIGKDNDEIIKILQKPTSQISLFDL